MKKALISVSDKTDIVWFAKNLIDLNYQIISTGGTKRALEQAGLNVTSIETVTGFPEILDGRVKTLHPKVHGGLLSLRDNLSHQEDIKANQIDYIDLVCVNLYPFKDTIAKPNVSFAEAIEQIDIGGPSMLRSAAKNYQFVTVVTDVKDYSRVIDELREHGDTTAQTKRELSAKVFQKTAHYDAIIASYLAGGTTVFQEENTMTFEFHQALRYGENPHQQAALYQTPFSNPYSLFQAEVLNGKPLSYNNIQDANAAINILKEHTRPTVVGLKHMNPCGVGSADTIEEAYRLAYQSDPVSIFGGIVATNQTITQTVATEMNKIFLEIIIAPNYDKDALEVLRKKKNLRVLRLDTEAPNTDTHTFVHVNGGVLIQETDRYLVAKEDLVCVTKQQPTDSELDDLLFAWKVVKHVKSNAIVVTKGTKTVGIGAGQMNRVGAANIALNWAKEHGHKTDLILASDAFFPFDDVVRLAASYGVKAIIQPGGSIRDNDSIAACDELGITMVFTGNRHFKH